MTGVSVLLFLVCLALALSSREVSRLTTRRGAVSTLIWRLKDEGRIAGPDAGALLSALYGDAEK